MGASMVGASMVERINEVVSRVGERFCLQTRYSTASCFSFPFLISRSPQSHILCLLSHLHTLIQSHPFPHSGLHLFLYLLQPTPPPPVLKDQSALNLCSSSIISHFSCLRIQPISPRIQVSSLIFYWGFIKACLFGSPKQIYAFECATAENLIDFANMGDYSVVLSVVVVMVLVWQASAQTCLKSFSSESKSYAICNNLAKLDAALSWTYFPGNGSIDMAFRATPAATAGWVGWGINPSSPAMLGTQALIAFKHTNGTMGVYTYDIQSKVAAPQPSNISIIVSNKSAIYESTTGHITIFATLTLPSNKTSINHVWQVGSQVINLAPQSHAMNQANLQSATTINLNTGVSSGSVVIPNKTLKDRHGVLNVVGWGILMPIGAMIARYLRMFESADPAWFYLHAFCQSSGYILGVAGWATGLKLGSDSPGVEQTSHRRIGIALFSLGTLQVFALLLRPKKDHKHRKYWNVYHYSIGYSVIILSIINIFKGYDILKPEDKWKHAYIAVIASLGGIAAVLEVATWIIFFQRKSKTSPRAVDTAYGNGGMNTGHGFKQSHDHNSV